MNETKDDELINENLNALLNKIRRVANKAIAAKEAEISYATKYIVTEMGRYMETNPEHGSEINDVFRFNIEVIRFSRDILDVKTSKYRHEILHVSVKKALEKHFGKKFTTYTFVDHTVNGNQFIEDINIEFVINHQKNCAI